MLVEHAFITTLGANEALACGRGALLMLGFEIEPGPDTGVVEGRRGLKKAAKAKTFSDLPQRVRLEYDRGRFSLAASVEIHRKPHTLHREMLLALARTLEAVIEKGQPVDQARTQWDAVGAQIGLLAKARSRRRFIVAVVLLLIIVGIVTVGLVLAAFAP